MTGDLALLRPAWLLALPALALCGWWLWTRRGGLGDWHRAADAPLLAAMAALGRVERGGGRGVLVTLLAALFLIALALSGPAMERRDTASFRNLDGVIFVVDVSESVASHARWPMMLTMGRFGIAALGTRPGALIVYAGDAYMATDLTRDHVQLGQTLSLVGPGLVPDPGSRPARALHMAADRLAGADIIAGDVILMTDGAGLGPESLRAAGRIAEAGARLSLVAFDTDAPALATHAAAGHGAVFALEETDGFARWMAEDARTRLERQDYPLLFRTDLGRYLLVLALVPVLMLFRRAA